MKQLRVPAVYMRGGTSKGVFFLGSALPAEPDARDRTLLRIMGSPDPYGKQIDGMGGATSSTSKVVVISKSQRADCDVDYLFGQVSVDRRVIDWSGNCGNLTAAVGPFALHSGLLRATDSGTALVRIWQANIGKRIHAHVPIDQGEVQELGSFYLDGVAFPAAEIPLEFLDPGDAAGGAMFPSGSRLDTVALSDGSWVEATLINAGNPTVFVAATALGLTGTEMQDDVNSDVALLDRLEEIRCKAAIMMGLAEAGDDVSLLRPATPKIAFVAAPDTYVASDGRVVRREDVNLVARIVSMNKLHHAMTGTGAIALAAAAAVPGTIVSRVSIGAPGAPIVFGHPSGTLRVGAQCEKRGGDWVVSCVSLSRSARRLMAGDVFVPQEA
ncbi:2-methylaconitate cis-trans isomerase PrpF [Bordetella genomosp. 8]|uniref:2-methylaconitate cis-trans isomerase PrpF n=1 Tax=Bordetella genomosp. 8 TaxID=1416806 RepID=A0A1W6YPT2_9BORD|nr:2-methylaconitate cis-trans isomerase PrpF [Bordetella genomosp. 8]ARP83004.1 2-methylaconitate cis-trans isomerase PrpF [Bordetella genomosp. 8]